MSNAEILPPENGGTPPLAPESGRISVIIMYALYFAAFITGITYFAAIVLAYVKKDDLRGTVYEGHIKNGIEVFWVTLIAGIFGWLTIWLGVGMVILFFTTIWYLFRTIKGFMRALDGRAYR